MEGYSEFARYYDALTENVGYLSRASYFDKLIRQHGGRPDDGLLLDLACGTGSLSLALVQLGYDVIGVDASAEMLSIAMDKAANAEQEILFLCQPMQRLDLYGTIRYCVCALDSLNHLPREADLARVISRVALFTEPGGLFLFDVNTRYKHREILADNTYVYEPGKLVCIWRNCYIPEDDSVEIVLDFFEEREDGSYQRSQERFCEQFYPRETVERLLRVNSFELLAVYGDDTLDPPSAHTQREIYVACKQ